MFSNLQLSSFVPNALLPSPKPAFDAESSTNSDDEDDVMDEPAVEETTKRKKEKAANESFIFVRPPPAKTNHPLNLQVQLVPPHAKTGERSSGSARQSLDLSAAPSGSEFASDVSHAQQESTDTTLTRTSSNRSEASMYSGYTSTASFSSVASSTSSRRMIIPLYNLQAHNVMQNLVVDAGTDAKIAKFMKRGMEVIDLAILEPVEVWGSSVGAIRHPDIMVQAGSSQVSVSPSMEPAKSTPAPIGVAIPAPAPTKRNIFGKLFSRKEPASAVNVEPPTPICNSLSTPRPNKRASGLFAGGVPLTAATSNSSSNSAAASSLVTTAADVTLRPPVLGIQPTFSSATNPPRGRPTMYVWVVRRWLKGSPTGLGSMMGRLQLGSNVPVPGSGVELRFEWKRSAKKITVKPSSRRASLSLTPQEKANRMSTMSVSTNLTASEDHHGEEGEGGDSGDESDPEDSEVPWTCTLKVRKLAKPPPPHRKTLSSSHTLLSPSISTAEDGLATPTPENPSPKPETMKFKLGTLSPTPHHPKVVALLKVPFPLPDIEVDNLVARKRVVTAQGVVLPSERPAEETSPEGLILTAEEIKDVVSSTGLWLVVRENFCGVGKVSRKGDGWHIRA